MQDFKDAHEYLMSKIKIKQKKNENGAKIVIFEICIKFRRGIGDAVRSWSV